MFPYQIDFCEKMITIEQVNVFNLLDPGDSCVLYERKKNHSLLRSIDINQLRICSAFYYV